MKLTKKRMNELPTTLSSLLLLDEGEEEWRRSLRGLKDALIKIKRKDGSELLSFEQLYRMTYEIVREKKFVELYDAACEIIFDHIHINLSDILRELSANSLGMLIKEWNDHIASASMFRDVLMFLEQAYIERENLENIYTMALKIFKNEVIRNNEVRDHIQNILLGMVFFERTGNSINHMQFKEVINMLLILSKLDENHKLEYEELFEKPFLLQSEIFYKQESQKLLSDNSIDVISYINNYELRYNQEKERVKRLLHDSTEKAILNILEKCLIKDHLYKIVDLKQGLKHMLKTACRKELTMLYEWYKNSGKEDEIIEMIIKIYKDYGFSIVEDETVLNKEHSKVVEDIVNLKDMYDEYSASCFQNNEKLKKSIEDNFILIFNQNPRMAEFLSSYMHETLRKCQKNLSDEEFEEKLEIFLKFFRLLSDKDIFERFYKNHLTKRLLTKPNLEIERKLISKFKTECGLAYTTQLEKMVTDIEVSSDHMDVFHGEIIQNNQSLAGIDFNMVVLNSGLWTISPFTHYNLPAAPSVLFELFKTFYIDIHNNRKLNLQANFGSAMLKLNLEKGIKNTKLKPRTIFLDVSTLQMIILMLFNDRECISIEEIGHITNITEDRLIASLNPIVIGNPMHRILRRVGEFPPNTPLKMDTVIAVNDDYYTKRSRIKVPFNAVQVDEKSDRQIIEERTNRERNYEIDAAIVRIMKNRKKLAHQELVAEVITALKTRFRPNVKSIDNRILQCIEREYITKIDGDESKTYVYIA